MVQKNTEKYINQQKWHYWPQASRLFWNEIPTGDIKILLNADIAAWEI